MPNGKLRTLQGEIDSADLPQTSRDIVMPVIERMAQQIAGLEGPRPGVNDPSVSGFGRRTAYRTRRATLQTTAVSSNEGSSCTAGRQSERSCAACQTRRIVTMSAPETR
jgi:hypothetical protein